MPKRYRQRYATTARRDYECSGCGSVIPKGKRYEWYVQTEQKKSTKYRFHESCVDVERENGGPLSPATPTRP